MGSFDFGKNIRDTLGEKGKYFLIFALLFNGFGSCITYLIITTDIVLPISKKLLPLFISEYVNRTNTVLFMGVFTALPLLFFKTLEPLAKFSEASIIFVPLVIIIFIIRAPVYFGSEMIFSASKNLASSVPEFKFFGSNPLPAIGIIAFALMCTQTAYQNYQSIDKSIVNGWRKASRFAVIVCVVIYLTFSIIGYLIFGNKVSPNVLNNFPETDNYINLARVLMALSIILTYPMQFYPMREILLPVFNISQEEIAPPSSFIENPNNASSSREQSTTIETTFNPKDSNFSYKNDSIESIFINSKATIMLTFTCFSITVIVAILVKDLGLLYKLIGTASASLLAFVFPAAIYLIVTDPRYSTIPLNNSSNFNSISQTENTQLISSVSRADTFLISSSNIDKVPVKAQLYRYVSWFTLFSGVVIFVIGTSVTLLSV
ncbi:Vacuolar amino acid transporter 2 [Smittium culicis]|uniref:Vacuolar amino acid transporter 2 n=1 Tax=Smittium culicis TaxID=133412 RepID=A0A1R1X1I8_9FUNG|nr:Vacuolar amino acid transporter 2 [Smittium culicis]